MPTIIDGTTGVDQIQNGTVTVNKIANGAVTETKIADGAVTAAKLAAGVISTTSVLAATAGASAGAVGTYAFLVGPVAYTLVEGGTKAGSELRFSSQIGGSTVENGATPAGTWRAMGSGSTTFPSNRWATVWLRIS